MEPPLKRQRTDDVESQPLPSLSVPISPPRKRNRPSPSVESLWELTWIRDLPEDHNRDAVTLKDLLGDPLIAECWEFNYLHDIDFLMNAFDSDTAHLVKIHVVHGFWKREDSNRLMLMQQASAFSNVELHTAPMPEMFGTHHSKMMILFRHDNTAQIIIHTANMISKDWTNMTNAVWRTPHLPKLKTPVLEHENLDKPLGSGSRFKNDLLNYLACYDSRRPTCKTLIDQIKTYDFAPVKAALIASVPGRHQLWDTSTTSWGHAAIRESLSLIPATPDESEVVVQISSIATLGPTDNWLQNTLFKALAATAGSFASTRPSFKVVFPTADEIRQSLDGYSSGGSIHTKIQSAQQAKQLQYLRPIFHHWANDSPEGMSLPNETTRAASGRARAAPHIKTYIRYNKTGSIDWALLTSANLSKQAWGDASQPSGEFRIASWEIGVLSWPTMFDQNALMMPTFQSDATLSDKTLREHDTIIRVKVPYNVPLQRYARHEIPWVATMAHAEPDRLGQTWGVEL